MDYSARFPVSPVSDWYGPCLGACTPTRRRLGPYFAGEQTEARERQRLAQAHREFTGGAGPGRGGRPGTTQDSAGPRPAPRAHLQARTSVQSARMHILASSFSACWGSFWVEKKIRVRGLEEARNASVKTQEFRRPGAPLPWHSPGSHRVSGPCWAGQDPAVTGTALVPPSWGSQSAEGTHPPHTVTTQSGPGWGGGGSPAHHVHLDEQDPQGEVLPQALQPLVDVVWVEVVVAEAEGRGKEGVGRVSGGLVSRRPREPLFTLTKRQSWDSRAGTWGSER